jgi:uncharacterized protein (DUF433 family)
MTNLVTTSYEHITLNEKGIPVIDGTTMKVVELIMAQKAHGWRPEELHYQHPYLNMSQIHSELSNYWDNKATLDADIEWREQYAEEMRLADGRSSLANRLRDQGLVE